MVSRRRDEQGLSRRSMLSGSTALSAVVLSGCAGLTPRNGISDVGLQRKAVISGLPGVRFWGDEVPSDLQAALHKAFSVSAQFVPATATAADGRPLVNVLALSGGGPDGAFGAGLLAGWTARGTRPTFQIVTGVSAGAIIAPLAFLGPHYDKSLAQIWTETKLTDLVVFQGVTGILGGTAAVDTAPLAAAIAKYVTPRLLREVAREYHRGRLLLIGTTNLDAQRPVVWNMGAIAASGHPDAVELFRKVILASAAIPGLFPPVAIEVEANGKIYEEMHVDGGTTRDVFVSPYPVAYNAFDRFYKAAPVRRLYIVANGKITPEPEIVTAQTLSIAARAISTLLKSQHVGEINLIYRRTQDSGAEFNLMAVPPDFAVADTSLGDPVYQKALYDVGYRLGREGGNWMKRPPVASDRRT